MTNPFIDGKTQKAIQSTIESMMTKSAKIERPNPDGDGRGGKLGGWFTVGDGIPCHVGFSSNPSTGQVAGVEVTQRTYEIKLPLGWWPKKRDRITVDGVVYEVIGSRKPDPPTHVRVNCVVP